MISGIINVYKEKGFTSHDVVAKLRGILGQKKIGHTGTLDPDAEGVLPVCLGKATKICDLLTDKDKTYEAVMLLGKTTDTQDISGRLLKEKEVGNISAENVAECIKSYIGGYDQLPPMYSALKVNGKKLYELAREGKEVERKPRKVIIYDIQIKDMSLPRVRMEVKCSKGTYIRTLCHDIGNMLGTGACMEALVRTKSGRFEIGDSVKIRELEEYKKSGSFMEHVIPVDEIFSEFPSAVVSGIQARLAYNGNPLKKGELNICHGEKIRVYDGDGIFIGLYSYDEPKNVFRPERMFLDEEELR